MNKNWETKYFTLLYKGIWNTKTIKYGLFELNL
jgi:hypothetical protein